MIDLADLRRQTAITYLALAAVSALAVAVGQIGFAIPDRHPLSPVDLASCAVVLLGLLHAGTETWLAKYDKPLRNRWALGGLGLALLAATLPLDWSPGADRTGYLLMILPLWAGGAAALHVFFRHYRDDRWVTLGARLGHLGAILVTALILAEAIRGAGLGLLPGEVGAPAGSPVEFAELACIEFYVVCLILAGQRQASEQSAALAADGTVIAAPFDPAIAPAARRTRAPAPLGETARRAYAELNLFHTARYPPVPFLLYPGIKPVFVVCAILLVAARAATVARRATGWPLHRQFADLFVLAFRDRVDPVTYYMQELARPGGRADARGYLTRFETKNGLMFALNNMTPSPHGTSELNDKLLFASCCERAGLPSPRILALVTDGAVEWRAPREAFDRDLFTKYRKSSGAKGTMLFRRVARDRYVGPDGTEHGLDGVMERVKEASRQKPIMVQPRMVNHPDLENLADLALITFRVITCLDERGMPEVTHGIMRIMKKLEADWNGSPDDEYGAPIDLRSGRLGLLTGDKLETHPLRFRRHPVTGRVAAGRVVEQWPALCALARRAHASFSHRVVIGWDMALTPEGPVILEGNGNFDVMFFQRVYRQPAGQSRLGELLEHHLGTLHDLRGRAD